MALIAHTFRIEQEALDELKRMGDGNESLGCRRALEKSRKREAKTFVFGVLAGVLASILAHIAILALAAQ